jgi:hypothetical protein
LVEVWDLVCLDLDDLGTLGLDLEAEVRLAAELASPVREAFLDASRDAVREGSADPVLDGLSELRREPSFDFMAVSLERLLEALLTRLFEEAPRRVYSTVWPRESALGAVDLRASVATLPATDLLVLDLMEDVFAADIVASSCALGDRKSVCYVKRA